MMERSGSNSNQSDVNGVFYSQDVMNQLNHFNLGSKEFISQTFF